MWQLAMHCHLILEVPTAVLCQNHAAVSADHQSNKFLRLLVCLTTKFQYKVDEEIQLANKSLFKMHKLDIILQARNFIFTGTFFSLWRHERACRHVKLGTGII